MKKILLVLVVLAALLTTGWLVFAKEEFVIRCCFKGKCATMTRPECSFNKGRIVQDCAQCR